MMATKRIKKKTQLFFEENVLKETSSFISVNTENLIKSDNKQIFGGI